MSAPNSIPFLDLEPQNGPLRQAIEAAIRSVIESQQFVMGPEVIAFEEEFARYCGTRFAIGCGSGSDALLLALMALDIGPGDQIICPAYTFFATASAITRLGGTPVFADIARGSYNLDPEQVRKAAARCSNLKALLPVDLFGQLADLGPLLDFADELGVPLVEDAAQSIGARDTESRAAGSAAMLGCFSLYPTKNLGAFGDAGIIVTDDPELAAHIGLLRNHGTRERYFHREVGVNSRLDAIQAAILRVKLRHVDDWNAARRRHAAHYRDRFEAAGAGEGADAPRDTALRLTAPGPFQPQREHVFNQYVIRVPATERDPLRAHLADQQIGTQIYYPLGLHQQECFQSLGYTEGDLPETEAAAKETLALPIYPGLTEEQVDRVADTVIAFLQRGN